MKINEEYIKIFREGNFIYKITEILLVFISEGTSFLCIYTIVIKFLDINMNYIFRFLLVTIIFLIIHYFMGYILYLSSNIHKFMFRGEEESLKAYFLLSYFITSVYFFILVLYPEHFKKYELTGLIGVFITYVLDLKILFKVMSNPSKIKLSEEDEGNALRIIVSGIILVTLIVINLYLGVCLVSALGETAYSNNPSFFDLFYYTIVTFTTIGFGDIIPLTVPAKVMAIVISVTSILCLTIFLGSILSFRRDKN